MAKKIYSITEFEELLLAAGAIEDKENQAAELKRIAALRTPQDETERAAIAARVAEAFNLAGIDVIVEKSKEELVSVKILSSIGSPIGCFAQGDEVMIPLTIAESWEQHGLCKKQ